MSFFLFFFVFFFYSRRDLGPFFVFFRQLNSTVENEKSIKKNEWIKAQQKKSLEETRGALRRRSSEYLSDPDPVTHRKKESVAILLLLERRRIESIFPASRGEQ